MVRQIQIVVPVDKIELVMDDLHANENVFGLRSYDNHDDTVMIVLKATDKRVRSIVSYLTEKGVGVTFGCIDIIELQSTIPRLVSTAAPVGQNIKKRKYVASDRMTIEEIYQFIDKRIHLTFDYIAFIIVAAIISGVGLVTNNGAIIVASMVLSPLMSPIMGLTLGTLIRDKAMCFKSFRNEVLGALITLIIGMIIGFVMAPFSKSWDEWLNVEMSNRGTPFSVLGGVIVAVPTGAGVAIAITGVASHSMVGVAISASLLPPIVNAGLNLSYGILHLCYYRSRHNDGDWNAGSLALETSFYSGSIFLCNFIIIYLVALLVFRLKNIQPLKHTSTLNQRASPEIGYSSLRHSLMTRRHSLESSESTTRRLLNSQQSTSSELSPLIESPAIVEDQPARPTIQAPLIV